MTVQTSQIRLRAALAFGAAAMLAMPAQASAPGSEYVSAPVEQGIAPDLDEAFAPFDELPDAPAPAGNVVDLTTIDPPIEEAPEPEPVDTASGRSLGTGIASYYGHRFHGRRTANGERFNMNAMTAAHKRLPFGSKVRVTNTGNGRSVIVRINDRGPFTPGRTIDLSRAAAQEIGLVQRGHGKVELELITS
ncbi:septal ring lytic transglycosylase RlpA family protein [Altererythrobacter sp. MTPC7]|uniref:septal ring lytic transglycosylase RlpA family protein n=1 Tax=Altererythrobacter sp. MTPC7 TaxID=3056567 RepID=UPI0036F2770D